MNHRICNLLALTAFLLTAGPALGQTDIGSVADITRDGADLRDVVARPVDPTIYDTALILTSRDGRDHVVVCAAYDDQGNFVGRGKVVVPAHGIRYALLSDLTAGQPFLGSVTCRTRGKMIGSAFLLGGAAGVTGAPAQTVSGPRRSTIVRYPVVFTR